MIRNPVMYSRLTLFRMKPGIQLIFAAILWLLSVNSQAQVIDKLTSPSMPAATIIGTQFNEINTPKSLKALETAIFNNFINAEGSSLIPGNYALEVNPFMLGKRTNFDYLDYLKDEIKLNLWRNLSFSVASTNNYIINDSITGSSLGFGGRTIILNGKVSQQLESTYINTANEYNSLLALQGQIRTMIGQYLRSLKPVSPAGLALPEVPFHPDSLKAFLLKTEILNKPEVSGIIDEVFNQLPVGTNKDNVRNEFLSVYKNTLSSITLTKYRALIDSVKTERYGLRWEIGAALALNFPTNDFGYSISPKQGIWSNISYRPFKKTESSLLSGIYYETPVNFEFIGLVRWINNNDEFINKYNPIDTLQFNAGEVWDIGLRGILEFGKLSVEVEYIYRNNRNREFITVDGNQFSRTVNDDTYKFLLNFNYNISDNLVLSYNIGRNYEVVNVNSGNLISGLSLNFGFGGVKKDDLLKEAMKRIDAQ